MTVGPPLQDLRILVLELLVLKMLLAFRSHNHLELVAHQLQTAVEVFSQACERLNAGVLNPLDHIEGLLLHDFKLGSQVHKIPFGTVSLK